MTMLVAFVCYFSQKLTGRLHFEMRSNPKCQLDFSRVNLNKKTLWTLIKKLCEPVPCLYAVTGSDFTCSFYGLDNTKGLFLLERNVLFINAFTLIELQENLTWKRAELKWLRDSFVNRMQTKICDAIWRVFGNRLLYIILRNLIQLTMTDMIQENLNLLVNFGNNFLWLQSWIFQNNQISVSELPVKT